MELSKEVKAIVAQHKQKLQKEGYILTSQTDFDKKFSKKKVPTVANCNPNRGGIRNYLNTMMVILFPFSVFLMLAAPKNDQVKGWGPLFFSFGIVLFFFLWGQRY